MNVMPCNRHILRSSLCNPELQVEARKLKPKTKYYYQFRYRQNDKTAPVGTTGPCPPWSTHSAVLLSLLSRRLQCVQIG